MLKNINFQRRVFILNATLILGILILVSTIFFVYIYNVLKSNSENYFSEVVEKVSTNIDSMLLTMDVVSTQLVASNDLQEIFSEANASPILDGNYFDFNLSQKKKGVDILISINSPKDRIGRISIFNSSNIFLSCSARLEDNKAVTQNIQLAKWSHYLDIHKTNYSILPPQKDEWIVGDSAPIVFSLVRPFIATYTNYEALGIIELQQDYSKISELCMLGDEKSGLKLTIIDQDKNIIYPYGKMSKNESVTYLESTRNVNPGIIYSFYNSVSNHKEYACYANTKNANWTVILSQPQSDFIKPAYYLFRLLLVVFFVFLLAVIFAIFLVSRSLTKPIKELRESLKNISFDNPNIILSTSHNEIELLKNAFNDMLVELKNSSNKIIKAQASELQAHFLALQAQINPHFLYNSLMSISAAGQEAGSKKIQIMCSQLGDIFRYIASEDIFNTTMVDELKHTEIYLNFIKWRYEELLDFSINVSNELYDLKVPKLIIQPIVENCFSHGFFKVRPPFKIMINGYIRENIWYIDIIDNGQGFNDTSLENIKNQFEKIDYNLKSGKITNKLEIGGMALINIYTRLKLLYNEKAVFVISNNRNGGSKVTIGGAFKIN